MTIAATAPLANVRLIAETAAAAWAHEAMNADRREARQARLQTIRVALEPRQAVAVG